MGDFYMTLMLRAAGVALAALVALLVLRGTGSTFTVFVKIGAVLLLFWLVSVGLARGISTIREVVSEFIEPDSFVGTSISVMIKALGISLIGRICSDICKECGESGLALGVESAAGVVIFLLSLPILTEILAFASDILSRGA
jgi:stage III sporulation protein AD